MNSEQTRELVTNKRSVGSLLRARMKSAHYWASGFRFRMKYGFRPPPRGTDLAGYEALIDFMEEHGILGIDGDLVEIGSFLGGGTYKLSKYLSKKNSGKLIYAIDVFDATSDSTRNVQGIAMNDYYTNMLQNRKQWDIFCRTTAGCDNIVTVKGDSKNVTLPTDKVCFVFIDGNHQPSYVSNDFYLVWPKLTIGGVAAFDDYGHDLPMVTKTIDGLLDKHSREIAGCSRKGKIIFIQKGTSP